MSIARFAMSFIEMWRFWRDGNGRTPGFAKIGGFGNGDVRFWKTHHERSPYCPTIDRIDYNLGIVLTA
jgi:hypothetical protein